MTIPQTPEAVAYKLMEDILAVEGKHLISSDRIGERPTRKDILETYAECIRVVQQTAIEKV